MNALIQFTERFGSMLSRILLTVLYFVLLGPFAIFYRLFADPLHVRRRAPRATGRPGRSTNDTLQAARAEARLMNVLGLSFFYHDSSAALVQDGKLIAAAEEERFSRRQARRGLPRSWRSSSA